MIAPLPPQAGLPQPADPATAKPDPRGDGDAFAEILAAAAAAVPALPRPSGPPTMDHGPLVMRIADIEPAAPPEPVKADVQAPPPMPVQAPLQVGLTDPAAEIEAPRADQPQPAARVFNQDGFFGTKVDAPAVTGPRMGPGTVSNPALLDADTPVVEAGIAPQPIPTGLDSRAEPVAAASIIRPASPLQPAPLAAKGLLAAPGAARPIALEAEVTPQEAKPATRRAALREPTSRATVQVAMRELEQGVHVAARAEGLDAAERVRLHDEITALLARHGLSARSIRISAPARARTSEEKLK